MDIYSLKFIGESTDIVPIVKSNNTVIKTPGKFELLASVSVFAAWEFCIIFPDNEKAKYFLDNCKNPMNDYRENMLKDDYVFHIVHFKYPKKDTLYADQIRMTKDFSFILD